MTKNRPSDTAIPELVHANLAGESAIGLVEDILSGDFNSSSQMLAGKKQIEGRGSNDDLYIQSAFQSGILADGLHLTGIGIEFGLVDIVHNVPNGLDSAVPGHKCK